MDYFDKHINKLFSGPKSDLPNEFSWENMQEGIANRLVELELVEKKKNRKRKTFFFILSASMIVGLLLSLKMCIPSDGVNVSEEVATISTNTNVKQEKNKEESLIKDELPKKSNLINTENENSKPEIKIAKTKTAKKEISIPHNTTTYNSAYQIQENKSIANFNVLPPKLNNNQNQQPQKLEKVNSPKVGFTVKEEKTVSRIASIVSSKLDFERDLLSGTGKLFTAPILNRNRENSGEDESQIEPSSLYVSSGFVHWNFGFGGDKLLRSEFEKTIPSFEIGLYYNQSIGSNYFIETGINYQQLESKFDWSGEIDLDVTIEDTVIAVTHNLITGVDHEHRGDYATTTKANRKVVHYNKAQVVSLPILIQRKFALKHFTFDVGLGSSFQLAKLGSGKTLSNGDILAYSEASEVYSKSIGVSGIGKIGVGFKLSKKIELGAYGSFQKSFTNWHLEQNSSIKPSAIGAGLNLRYRL